MSEEYGAKCLSKMFPDRGWNFGQLMTIIGEMTAAPVFRRGRPHCAHNCKDR